MFKGILIVTYIKIPGFFKKNLIMRKIYIFYIWRAVYFFEIERK